MKMTCEDYDQLAVMKLQGEFTADQVDPFQRIVRDRMNQHQIRDFVLDCELLEFIDSQGLETLLWLQETCGEHLGQVRLASVKENVAKILELTRLAARFDCHSGAEAAIKSLR